VLAPATLAALPSTRAIPDRDVFYVARPSALHFSFLLLTFRFGIHHRVFLLHNLYFLIAALSAALVAIAVATGFALMLVGAMAQG
jgi:hypothetical protein